MADRACAGKISEKAVENKTLKNVFIKLNRGELFEQLRWGETFCRVFFRYLLTPGEEFFPLSSETIFHPQLNLVSSFPTGTNVILRTPSKGELFLSKRIFIIEIKNADSF